MSQKLGGVVMVCQKMGGEYTYAIPSGKTIGQMDQGYYMISPAKWLHQLHVGESTHFYPSLFGPLRRYHPQNQALGISLESA